VIKSPLLGVTAAAFVGQVFISQAAREFWPKKICVRIQIFSQNGGSSFLWLFVNVSEFVKGIDSVSDWLCVEREKDTEAEANVEDGSDQSVVKQEMEIDDDVINEDDEDKTLYEVGHC